MSAMAKRAHGRRGYFFLLLLLLMPRGAGADAPAVDEARRAFFDGVEQYRGHHYEAALERFGKSYALNPVPGVLHNIALTQKALGQYRAAIDSFNRYVQQASAAPGGVTADRRAEDERSIAEAQSHLSSEDHGEHGEHVDPARSPPPAPRETHREPAPSDDNSPPPPPLVLTPLPPPRVYPPRAIAGITIGVVSLVSLVVWGGTGGAALTDRSNYDRSCNLGICEQPLYDSGRHLAIASDFFLALSAASAVTTMALLLPAWRSHHVALAPSVAPNWLALTGAF